MRTIASWLVAPLGIYVTSQILLALATLVFKKRTPEEYAASAARKPEWLFSRVTAFWKLAGAMNIDPAKVAEAAMQVVTGYVAPLAQGVTVAKGRTNPPPPSTPPSGPGRGLALLEELPVIDMGDHDDDQAEPDTIPETPAARSGTRLFFAVFAAGAIVLFGCSPAPPLPPMTAEQKKTAAEIAYGALIQECVAKAAARMPDKTAASVRRSRAEADACADEVDRTWSDAGTPGGGAR